MPRRIKYLVGFVVMGAAVTYLGFTTFRSSLQYYITVGELFAAESDYQGRTIKLAGIAHNIVREEKEGPHFRFDVVEGEKSVLVAYRGLVPDTFREGSQVVVTGQLASDGSLQATEILAKCASKYEAKLKGSS